MEDFSLRVTRTTLSVASHVGALMASHVGALMASHVGALGVAHLAGKVPKVVPLVRDELLVEAEEAERVEVLGLHRFRRFRAKG
jgi:hypothetical protein